MLFFDFFQLVRSSSTLAVVKNKGSLPQLLATYGNNAVLLLTGMCRHTANITPRQSSNMQKTEAVGVTGKVLDWKLYFKTRCIRPHILHDIRNQLHR